VRKDTGIDCLRTPISKSERSGAPALCRIACMKPLWVLGVALLLTASVHPQSSDDTAPHTLVKTTLCEIKSHPEKFEHVYVEFTAIATHGFEDSMVESHDCIWAVNGNPGVWMEFGGTVGTETMYCCGTAAKPARPEELKIDGIDLPLVDDDIFRTFNARLHPKHDRPTQDSDAVSATMRGTIFARQGQQKWQPKWEGYGHMGCCMLFVVQQVTFVDPNAVKREWAH